MTGPIAFREIVLKVHSRCDLSCDHCYVYEHADQSWRTRPKVISPEIVALTAARLAEHARAHALPSVTVILHGGEPLLAGPDRLRLVCEEFTRALDGIAALDLRMHTNGLRLDRRFLDLFAEYGLKVGVSLDGDRAANDRHRRFADGRTSHPLVLAAVDLLRSPPYRHLYQGLLCTVDAANDPLAVVDALVALEPPRIDFLLPHATWEHPPPRPDGAPDTYARWLLRAFDHWDRLGRPVPVRIFDSLFSTLRGGPSLTESLGLTPTDLVVVETDGSLEQVDSLKSAYEGAAATGFHVREHPLDLVARHPGVRARQLGLDGVGPTCRTCPVVRSCGGGLYTHRYRPGNGFDNPSVYCADLRELVDGVAGRIAAEALAPALREPALRTAGQDRLTRLLPARLHAEFAGRPAWDRPWAALLEVEAAGPEGARAVDTVLAHPYTRAWALAALAAGDPDRRADLAAPRLAALAAVAALRARRPEPVEVPYRAGLLHLPTLGTLRLGGPDSSGTVVLRDDPDAEDGGWWARIGRGELRCAPGAGDVHWQPLRTLPGPGAAAGGPETLLLDDLDPHRDCHPRPPAPRLDAGRAREWAGRLALAWAELRRRRPALPPGCLDPQADLGVLTPLLPGPRAAGPAPGRAGPGAVGLVWTDPPAALAPALLVAARRARLRELAEVADLYALDGQRAHPSPWGGPDLPFSALLGEVADRLTLAVWALAGGGADPEGVARVRVGLDRLAGAAEPTLSGLRVVADLAEELKAAGG
ncbi:radical SAM/SPASM protein FxsBH, inactivated beta-hydroxylase extension form [Streptomyces sp. BI20]|uniref:radical SAM/SPASM protein FxsBH, inactivated beta-hydroxylase extension form n=1 Tax=Streptomyces sp. BI20 TaxID=3403460 RepID=UPI003C78DF2A